MDQGSDDEGGHYIGSALVFAMSGAVIGFLMAGKFRKAVIALASISLGGIVGWCARSLYR